MLDRESTFAHPGIVKLLQSEFIPVAIDQAYQRRQKDDEGDFYRKLASQSPRNNFQQTTQGFYVGTSAGKLLFYNNNRDPDKVFRLMRESLDKFNELPANERTADAIVSKTKDKRYSPTLPEGGLVVRVRAKVLGGYEPTDDRWRAIFQSAVSRDNLWLTKAEHQQLAAGKVAPSLAQRIARFHLVDNTRGEPPMWRVNEIKEIQMDLNDGQLTGVVELQTADGKRGGRFLIAGRIAVEGQRITRLEIAAKGDCWGEGPFTRGAPKGKFPLAVTFELADPGDGDPADRVPPQGSRGWLQGYLR